NQFSPIFVPGNSPALADTRQFVEQSEEQVISNFAASVKHATGGSVIVGARFGEFLGGTFYNYPLNATWSSAQSFIDHPRAGGIYTDPNMDFFEVWDPYYIARTFGYYGGSGTPMIPSQGLALNNKLYMIQNDFRTYAV